MARVEIEVLVDHPGGGSPVEPGVYEPGLRAEVKVSDEWKSLAGVTSGAVGPKETWGERGTRVGPEEPQLSGHGRTEQRQ